MPSPLHVVRFLFGLLVLSTHTEQATSLRLPPFLNNIFKPSWFRGSKHATLRATVSPRLSYVSRAAYHLSPPPPEGASRGTAQDLPSAAKALDSPAVATVFAKDAHKWMGKLAEDSYPELDKALVMELGRLASIAYCSRPELLQAWNCSRCASVPAFKIHTVVWDPVWDLVGYVGFHSELNAIITSFRGTDSGNWGNWVENMRSWRTDKMFPIPGNPHALVHSGFEVLWSSSMMKASVTDAVQQLVQLHPRSKLYSVGHSMGAALAQLCALDMKFMYNISYVGTVTFGAPRVGNLAYQQLFDMYMNESWRFTHNRDVVPSVPLELMGFHHVAREIWEVDVETTGSTVETKWLVCDETGEDPSCHNSACYLGICTSIADHLTYLGLNMYQDEDDC